ncbi:MAG: transcriptional repressor LexA [Anaerolineae bacterium]
MEERLSERQRKILAFIQEFVGQNNYPPTYEEIRTALGISTKSLVDHHLAVLEEAGCLARVPNTPRGIRLLQPKTFRVPKLGVIAAGLPIATGDPDPEDFIELTRDIVAEQEGLYALQVKGDSMIDALVDDGDIVILKQQDAARNGDMVAVWLSDRDETTLKRFYRESDRVRLQPANPSIPPIFVHPSAVHVQGRVVAVIRQAP